MSTHPQKHTQTPKQKLQTKPIPRVVHLELAYHELAAATRTHGIHMMHGGNEWHGGLDTVDKIASTLETGSDYQLRESLALLDKISAALDMTGLVRETELSVVGSGPSVAAYLSGAPNCMRRTVEVEDQAHGAPTTVFFGLVSSASISAQDLSLRAAAILAFAQALSLVRPVDLVGIVAMQVGYPRTPQDQVIRIRIGMAPIDMSAMCALAHPGTQRGALYGICEGICTAGPMGHDNALRWPNVGEAKHANCQPGDVFFKSPHTTDDMDALRADPVAWVEAQLRLALAGAGAAYEGQRDADDN